MDTNNNTLSWEGLQDMWALNDDDIEIYTVADDDEPYDLAGVPVVGVIILTVVLSACVCSAVFYCSYRQERTGSCCGKRREDSTDEECQSLQNRSNDDIETGLTLKRWDTIGEIFHDESTEASGFESDEALNDKTRSESAKQSSDDKTCTVQFTAADISRASTSVDETPSTSLKSVSYTTTTRETGSKILLQNPSVTALAQKPRCVLCSKHFNGSDMVSESSDPTCHHIFHQTCIVSWLRKRNGCPVCKKSYMGETVMNTAEKVAEESETSTCSIVTAEDSKLNNNTSEQVDLGKVVTVNELGDDLTEIVTNVRKDDLEKEEMVEELSVQEGCESGETAVTTDADHKDESKDDSKKEARTKESTDDTNDNDLDENEEDFAVVEIV